MRAVSLLLAVAAALAGGCGGTSASKPSAGRTTAPAAAQTLKVSEREFAITPDSLTIARPGAYTFQVSNDGKIGHALEVEGKGLETKTGTIAPGSSTTLTVTFAKPGKYELYCPVDGHAGKGMKATITVQGAASSPGLNGTSPAPTTTASEPAQPVAPARREER
jgi:uncharacterized cupredoxin-like copper-binding protein